MFVSEANWVLMRT